MGDADSLVVLNALAGADSGRVPPWGSFAACHFFWPMVIQVLVTVVLFPMQNAFTRSSESSHRFRWHVDEFLEKYGKRTRQDGLRLWYLGNLLQFVTSLIAVYEYAYRTHTADETLSDSQLHGDWALSIVFAVLYLVEVVRTGFSVASAWRCQALVDVLTIVPVLMPFDMNLRRIPIEQRWLSLNFLRTLPALIASHELSGLFPRGQLMSELASRLVLTCLRTLALVVCMGGAIFVLEVLGEIPGFQPRKISTEMGDLSFMLMNYWIITTISTVGYGDYSPKTVPSQFVIIIFIFAGGIFFGFETSSIASLKWSLDEGHGRYILARSSDRHVLVCGTGVSKLTSMMKTFIQGLAEPSSRTGDLANIILLSDEEYDKGLVDFVKKQVQPHMKKQIYMLRGSSFNSCDLDRAHVSSCDMVFVLPLIASKDFFEQDKENTLRTLELQRLHPEVRVRLMLLAESSGETAVALGVPRERCFSFNGLKASVLATTSRVKGFPGMVAGLLDDCDWKRHYPDLDRSSEFMRAHVGSLCKNVRTLLIGQAFEGLPWWKAVTKAYEESRGEVLFVGAQVDGKVQLNPDTALVAGQVILAVCETRDSLAPFRYDTDQDTRTVFRLRRAEMLRARGRQARFGHRDTSKIQVCTGGAEAHVSLNDQGRVRGRHGSTASGDSEALATAVEVKSQGKARPAKIAEHAIDRFDGLKTQPCLVLIIALDTCVATWDHIGKAISSMRSEFLPAFQPIVVFSPKRAPDDILKRWADDDCAFMAGNIMDKDMLKYAGASTAEHVMVFRGVRHEGVEHREMSELDVNSDDYKALTIGLVLSTIASQHARFEVFELGSTQAAIAMEKQLEIAMPSVQGGQVADVVGKNSSYGLHYLAHGVMKHATEITKRGRHHDNPSNREFIILRSFAAGRTFTPEFFGCLLSTMFTFPPNIELIQAMCCPEDHGQTSFVWQVSCPANWIDSTYRDLLLTWARGGENAGKCLCQDPVIVLSIYRNEQHADGLETALNLTLPDPETKLRASDLVTVLGPQAFGEKAFEASILRGCPPANEPGRSALDHSI